MGCANHLKMYAKPIKMACSLDANVLSLFSIHSLHSSQRSTWRSWHIVSNRFKCLWAGHFLHTNRNTKIWTAWLIPLVILVGVSSNKSKQGVHPKSIGTVCFIPGQTHLATHVPSFTSRSSEILLWCLFNIATWEKKKSGCSGRTNRTQWCETASWKFQATVAGLHMASHVPCDLKIWLQMHGIPVQACPWNFESWSWLGGLGRWEQKKCVDMVWFHPIHLHGEPGLFSQGLEEPGDGAESHPNSDWGRCLNLMRWHVWFTLRFRCPA